MFDDRPPRPRGSLWPTLILLAGAAALAAAPAGADAAFRTAALDAAGPLAGLLRGFAPAADDPEPPPVAALAGEVARLRSALAVAESRGAAEDALVRPSWLAVRALGSTGSRGEVADLLIAAAGSDAAAADAAGLRGDLPALDAGADRQVRPGDVVTVGNAAVGRVAAVGRWTATVRPPTDPDFRLAVRVGDHEGVLTGAAGGPTVRFLPAAADVRAGQLVTTDAAEAGGAGLPVGVVTAAHKTPGGAEWVVRVRPLADLADARGEVNVVRAGLNRRRVAAGEPR